MCCTYRCIVAQFKCGTEVETSSRFMLCFFEQQSSMHSTCSGLYAGKLFRYIKASHYALASYNCIFAMDFAGSHFCSRSSSWAQLTVLLTQELWTYAQRLVDRCDQVLLGGQNVADHTVVMRLCKKLSGRLGRNVDCIQSDDVIVREAVSLLQSMDLRF